MQYRADVDGLRAAAVSGVVLFHVMPQIAPAGFLGVDVFFVISGYVISFTLLGRAIEGQSLSISDFYMRRIRRIIPALFVVCLATTVAASVILFPSDLISSANDLMSAAGFVANIQFYLSTNYFSGPAEAKPFLHLWSLSVEEQFYILFPLLVLVSLKARVLLRMFIITGLISFAAYAWMSGRDPSAAFYLLPFRVWELMLGAVTAVLVLRLNPPHPITAGLAWLGLAAILFAFARSTPITAEFPPLAGVMACLGTASILAFNTGPFAVRLLSLKPIVFVGLISYSLYLWHWPVFALARYYLFGPVGWEWSLALIATSIALAALTWRYVETPFRNRAPSWQRAAGATAVAMSLLAIPGLALVKLNGLPFRISSKALAAASFPDRQSLIFDEAIRLRKCLLLPEQSAADFDAVCLARHQSEKAILLWGDSYAAHYLPGLKGELERTGAAYLMQATAAGCPPVLDRTMPGQPACRQLNDFFFGKIVETKPDLVVLSATWAAFDVLAELETTILRLKQNGIRSIVLGPSPVYSAPLPQIIARTAGEANLSRFILPAAFQTDHRMSARFENYISIIDVMCAESCVSVSEGDPVAVDTGHLSPAGSAYIAKRIAPRLIAAAQ